MVGSVRKSSDRLQLGLYVLGGLAIVCAAWRATPVVASLDDSYIALASAQTLVRGSDPSTGSPALMGATSPPYVAFLAVVLRLPVSPLTVLRLSAALSGAALALSLWTLARAAGLRWFTAVPFTIVIMASGQTWMVSTNGLETGLALALLNGMLAATLTSRREVVALGAGLLPWLRPDLAPAAGMLLIWTLWPEDGRTRLRLVGLTLLVAAPFALWLRADTGAWTPQTMQAKYAFFAEGCWAVRDKLTLTYSILKLWILALAPASLGLLVVWRLRLGLLGLVATALTLCGYFWFFPGGLAHNSMRYLFPILLPWAALGWVGALQRWPREGTVGVMVVAVVAMMLMPPQHASREFIATELVDLSAWLERRVPHDATLLVHDVGAVSVLTTHRLVDLVGLKTPSSSAVHQAITLPSCGARRGEAVVEIARRRHADYLVVLDGWERPFGLAAALAQAGMLGRAVRTPPASWPNGYTVYRLQPPAPTPSP